MKSRLIEKNQAIELRKSGQSLTEISEKIKVSKGLLSGWFKNLALSPEEILAIKNHGADKRGRGRLRASITNKYKRAQRENLVSETAKKKFAKLKNESAFLVGISLYWAEGSKQTGEFQFTNSDPDMILFIYNWIEKYLGIENKKINLRLLVSKNSNDEHFLSQWATLLGRETANLRKTILKQRRKTSKSPDYKGSLELSIPGIHTLRLMKAWQKLLVSHLTTKN